MSVCVGGGGECRKLLEIFRSYYYCGGFLLVIKYGEEKKEESS